MLSVVVSLLMTLWEQLLNRNCCLDLLVLVEEMMCSYLHKEEEIQWKAIRIPMSC